MHTAKHLPRLRGNDSAALPTPEIAGQTGAAWRRPPARRLAQGALLPVADQLLRIVGPRYGVFFWLISHAPPSALDALGRWRAERAVEHAAKRVPALRLHYASASAESATVGPLRVPATDKAGYVLRYPVAERCLDGRLPEHGVTIDESSGSTGTPFNWVRSKQERHATHLFISHFARYCFGDEPFITLNAFTMGAWATGVNMAVALERTSIVKSTGPDVAKLFRTLEFLGTHHRYLICGYPPFLKHLIDEARAQGFPLERYRLMGLVGGEGMSEGLRDYLLPVFNPVYSGYGATDIEIGLAGESPLSVAIRRLARRDPHVREALFGADARLPMLFQYNPLQHHVQVNADGELLFTVNRLDVLAPRIAYNIHDEGGVARYDELAARLKALDIDISTLTPGDAPPVRLPFVWVYGRKDSTVSVMGANLYPEDLEQALYDAPELAARTHSFCLSLHEDDEGGVRPCLSFEVTGAIDATLQAAFEQHITASLYAMNADFREAMHEHPGAITPLIRLYPLGAGPFAADSGKIKQTRIISVAR